MPATDLMSSPTSASRTIFTAGTPPITAASNSSGTPCLSASAASSAPCSAIRALLAVTTGLPARRAASTAALAGPSEPPISSTKMSVSPEVASATGSSNQGRPEMSKGRGRERDRAETPVTAARPPAGAKSGRSARKVRSPVPTVPRPATPTRQMRLSLIRLRSSGPSSRCPALTGSPRRSLCEGGSLGRQGIVGAGQDVVGLAEELLHIAGGLADAVLVLHQAHAHEALAIFAEADARRHGHAGLLDQQLGEQQRARFLELLGHRGPGEHRGAGRRDVPAGALHGLHQHVA